MAGVVHRAVRVWRQGWRCATPVRHVLGAVVSLAGAAGALWSGPKLVAAIAAASAASIVVWAAVSVAVCVAGLWALAALSASVAGGVGGVPRQGGRVFVRGALVWCALLVGLGVVSGLVGVGTWWLTSGPLAVWTSTVVRGVLATWGGLVVVVVGPWILALMLRLWTCPGESLASAGRWAGRRYRDLVPVALCAAGVGVGVWGLGRSLGAAGVWPWVADGVLGALLVVAGQASVVVMVHLACSGQAVRGDVGRAVRRGRRVAGRGVSVVVWGRRRRGVMVRAVMAGVAAVGIGVSVVVPAGVASALDRSQVVARLHPMTAPVAARAVTQLPDPAAADEAPLQEPEPVEEPAQPAGELVDGGDGWATYRTGPRTFSTVLGGVAQTFVGDDGQIAQVDNTLVPVAGTRSQPGYFGNRAGAVGVRIPQVMDADHGIVFTREGLSVEMSPNAGNWSRPVVQGSAVLFNDVFEGVDVQYSLVGSVVKEDFVLDRYMEVPDLGMRITAAEGLTWSSAQGAGGGDVLFATAQHASDRLEAGEVVFSFSAPAMSDAAGAFSAALGMDARIGGQVAHVSLSPDQGWLADPARVFPVRIVALSTPSGPTVTARSGSIMTA